MLNNKISKTFFILALLSSLLFFVACEEDSPVELDDVILDGVDVLLIETWDTYEMQEDGDLLIPVLVEEQTLEITKHDMLVEGVSVKPAEQEIYFEDNQIYVTDGEINTYLYDYYYNDSSKALWLAEDSSDSNTLADSTGNVISPLDMEDADLNDYTLYFVSGQGPNLNLLTPGDGFYVNSLEPEFTWSQYVGADQYTIVCATDEDFNNIVFETTTGDTDYTHSTELANFTAYYWQVMAENSVWSETWSFTTNYVVTLISPQNDSSASLKPKFVWEELDGATEYTLQVSESGDFDTLLYEEVLTDHEFNIPEYLAENTTYFWRVKTDTSGDHWSEIRLFQTDIVVLLDAPQNEATEVAVPVVFSWAQLDNADNYTIQVYTDEEMSDLVFEEQFAAAGNWTEPGILTANVDGYYWRITSDVAVGWSDINYFITNDGVFLNTPVDGAGTGANEIGLGVIVSLGWLEYANSGGYQIQLATDENFSDLVIEAEVDDETLTYVTEIDLELGTTYYWRVKAMVSNWSEARYFVTRESYTEDDILLQYPVSDSETDAVSQLPSFVWERFAGSSHYRIQIAQDANFSDPLIESRITSNTYPIESGDELQYNGVYYWRVRSDISDWCDPFVFRVKSGILDLQSVGNFAYKVDLTWIDRTAGETGFEIERATSADGPFELVGTSQADYNSFVDLNLEHNTTYWYRSRTLSVAGDSEYNIPVSVTTATFDGLTNQPEMVSVTAGTFSMGSADGDADEAPVHDVTLSNNFEIGKYEVTNAQFAEIMNWALGKGMLTRVYTANSDPIIYEDGFGPTDNAARQSKYIKASGICQVSFSTSEKQYVVEPGFENHPVSDVTWFGAALYANCLSAIDGLEQVYDYWDSDVYGTNGYRLPTEAEWEFTAQYNDGRIYPWGDATPTDELANYYDLESAENSIMPIGSYSAGNNQLGIADMAGNVWEWCNDVYDAEYYSTSPASDPEGPAIGIESSPFVRAVIRGGSWEMPVSSVRNANRSMSKPNLDYGRTNTAIGFRILRTN